MFAPVLRAFGRPPLTLFTNGRKVSELGLSDDQLRALQANGCDWTESSIARVTPTRVHSTAPQLEPSTVVLPPSGEGLKVDLTDGTSVDIGMMYAATTLARAWRKCMSPVDQLSSLRYAVMLCGCVRYIRPPFLHSPLVTQLGLKLKEPFMTVDVDLFNKSTSHPLVFVAGDVMTPFSAVAVAISRRRHCWLRAAITTWRGRTGRRR